MTDSEPEPEPNNLRQINRRAQLALINHQKYKYNDLCILFMDGMALWRDGKIQIGMTKYPMSCLTRRLVQREYKKLYENANSFVQTALRYLIMTSSLTGLIWFGMLLGGKQNPKQTFNRNASDTTQTILNKVEKAQLNTICLFDSISRRER